MDFYTPDANGSDEYRVQRSGDLVPPDGGKRTLTYLQFPLLNEERVHTYYLRIKTQSSVILDLKILQRDTLITQTIHEQYFQGAYFGLMCVMALYNFFVFLVIRDRSYLYYTGFITSTAVFQIALHGYAGVHFWPESVWWNNISNLFAACLSVGFCGKFAQNFIQLKLYHYTLDRVISWSAAGCFCIVIRMILALSVCLARLRVGKFMQKPTWRSTPNQVGEKQKQSKRRIQCMEKSTKTNRRRR